MKNTPDQDNISLIELLFFAYRDFTSDPDSILKEMKFGRAHHRVLHFVYRKPGMTVAELLDILTITKQSLARVLKDLIEAELIEQKPGPKDKRQRLLFATEKGQRLGKKLIKIQIRRIEKALEELDGNAQSVVEQFLFAMTDKEGRRRVSEVTGRKDLIRK
jgi:DNA-binding MarR family transcriptional regulator